MENDEEVKPDCAPGSVEKLVLRTRSGREVLLVPRPDGRGALLNGGHVGSGGSPGSAPDRIRRSARRLLLTRLDLVARIADGKPARLPGEDAKFRSVIPTPRDQLLAIKLLADVGLGPSVTLADVRERLRSQAQTIRDLVGDGTRGVTADELLSALSRCWK